MCILVWLQPKHRSGRPERYIFNYKKLNLLDQSIQEKSTLLDFENKITDLGPKTNVMDQAF